MCLQYCKQDKSYFLVNETVPLVFLVSEDIGTSGDNYDRSVLLTVFHSAFPTLLSTCLHIPLSFLLSLPLSSFSLSEDGECWSIGVSSSFGFFLLRDLLYLVEKRFICTLQIQCWLTHFSDWGFTAGRERERERWEEAFLLLVCVFVCFMLESHSIKFTFGFFLVLLFVSVFQCLWAQRTILRLCAPTRTPPEN